MSLHRPAALAALRHRDFARYAAGRFCATLAWQMLSVAVGWQVYEFTRDPLALGIIGLAQFLPFLALVLPAGQIADRADRRLLLALSYGLDAVSVAALFAVSLAGLEIVWPIFAAMVLFGVGRAFWMPTGQAMTPNLVPVEDFNAATAVNSALFEIAVVTGPALGGLLFLLGAPVVYGTALLLMVLVVVLLLRIRPVRATSADQPFRLRDTLAGLRFVWRRKPVLGAISLDLFAVLLGGATALLPIYARDVLHIGPAGLGVLRTAPAVGAAVTATLLAFAPLQRHVGRWMFLGTGIFAVATIIFGISTTFWVSLVALVALGAGDMVSVYIRHVLVQLETPDSIRGRVSAVNSMFIGASNELGEFRAGVAARLFGLVPAVAWGGVACGAVVAAYVVTFRSLRRLDRFPEPNRDPPVGAP
ncbi:MAG: Enterobactin exporter EntS [Steroidobacteraceae bacterium]|nr:Enterobactin exporter EntS [Steroidobacteraceae bacterium]